MIGIENESRLILQVFREVLAQAKAGDVASPAVGICFNGQGIAVKLSRPDVCIYKAVEFLSVGWPHHSGTNLYPVKRTEGLKVMGGGFWKGEQLALRISLLEYMIAKIEARLKDMED